MERRILNEDELTDALATMDGWTAGDKMLKKRLKFENFAAALEFVNQVGALAEAADHHPDITFGWGYAEVALTTHDRGGVTDVDVALAGKIDSLVSDL
jgi:4a-hydroxytetrahydrobiopterin dehydratase